MNENVGKLIISGVCLAVSAILIGASFKMMSTAKKYANKSFSVIEGYAVDDLQYVQNEIDSFVSGARMKAIIYHYNGYLPYAYITENSYDDSATATPPGPFYSYNGCNITNNDNYVADTYKFYFVVDKSGEKPFLKFVQDSLSTSRLTECDYNKADSQMNSVALQINNAKNVTNEKFAYNTMLEALRDVSMIELRDLLTRGEAQDAKYWTDRTVSRRDVFDNLLKDNPSFYNYRGW